MFVCAKVPVKVCRTAGEGNVSLLNICSATLRVAACFAPHTDASTSGALGWRRVWVLIYAPVWVRAYVCPCVCTLGGRMSSQADAWHSETS